MSLSDSHNVNFLFACELFPLISWIYNPFSFQYSLYNQQNLLLKGVLLSLNEIWRRPFVWIVIFALLSLELMGTYLSKDKETFLFHNIVKMLGDVMIDICVAETAETQTFPFLKSIYVILPFEISYSFIMKSVR